MILTGHDVRVNEFKSENYDFGVNKEYIFNDSTINLRFSKHLYVLELNFAEYNIQFEGKFILEIFRDLMQSKELVNFSYTQMDSQGQELYNVEFIGTIDRFEIAIEVGEINTIYVALTTTDSPKITYHRN